MFKNKKTNTGKGRFAQTSNQLMGNPQSFIIPNELDVRLKFVDQVSTTSILTYGNYTLNPNCPYDVDPAFGSTATGGFAELAAMFQFQRTIAYGYDISVVNQCPGNQQAQVTVINVNVTPPSAAYFALAGNQFSQTKTIQPQLVAGSIARFKGKHSVCDIVGSKVPETADSFASLTNSVPTDKIWIGIGITNIQGGTGNFIAMVQIEMWIRFYERKNLSS